MGSSKGVGVGAGVGLKEIPMGTRKMVMSLKEIVNNVPESEIYSTLLDCNMDPNEAVNRLLSQDPFHEVKSKREKKKENKDTSEGRLRGGSSTSNRGSKSGADRYGSGGSTQFSSTESGTTHGKPAYKKNNSSASYTGSLSSTPGMAGYTNKRPSAPSYAANDDTVSTGSTFVEISPAPQPPSAYQSTWVGVPGQVSMADIVKMGRPQNKASDPPKTSQLYVQGHSSPSPHHNLQFSGDHSSKASEVNPHSGVTQHVSVEEEWPLIEPSSAAGVPYVLEPPADTKPYPDPSELSYDEIDTHDQTDDIQAVNDGAMENLSVDHVGSASVSGGASPRDYEEHNPDIEHHEVQEVDVSLSSVTESLQQMNIQKEDQGLPSEENNPYVLIPDHLQVQNADCSHLSFGSFRVAFSAPSASMPVNTNLEEATMVADASSVSHSDARTSEYYGDESFRNASDGNLFQRDGAGSSNYDLTSASQQEALKPENPEIEHGNQYGYPSSTPVYSFENTQQVNATSDQSQTGSQAQEHAPFSNVMQAYTNSLPNTLLAANVHPGRESDLQYSPYAMAQSMPAKYGNTVSSISGSAMPEALNNAGFSSAQPTQHNLSGTSIATGPALPQHLAVHPYSQHNLPLGPFTNMIGYPFLPQSYTYMPSGFQQAYAGNNAYHQSLAAAALPQYKSNASVNSLPQSAAVASGYGGAFGNTSTIPGNFPMNPPAAPSGSALSYDDVLREQYKEHSHLMSLQQGDNSTMWLQGPGSRTMSAVPANTYYNFQGQNQQGGGFRQGQQPSQNYGTPGYPNFYHSQTGISMENQQQNPREGSLGGSQGQPNQSQQLWQNSY